MMPTALRVIGLVAVLLGYAWPTRAVDAAAAGVLPALRGVTLVEGRHASFLQNAPVSAFRVYAFHGGAFVPIPFQVDERDYRDRWVLDRGPRKNWDKPKGQFDANDAVVFMNRDLGARGDPSLLPGGGSAWAEIRVGDEVAPLGFAYVGLFETAPPSPYAGKIASRYDPKTDRIYGERYALGLGAALPTHVAFVDRMGDFGVNTVAGIRAAGEVLFLGGLLRLARTDQDIHDELQGYRHGPVRTIRRGRYWIPLPFGFRATGRVDLILYPEFVEGTSGVRIDIPPRLLLANGELTTYFDFLDLSGAHLLIDGASPSGPIDGRMTPREKALAGRPARWAALMLPDGRTFLFAIRLEGTLDRLEQRLYFQDGPVGDQGSGGKPRFGFHFTRVDRLEAGKHRLSVFGIVLEDSDPETIRRTANVFLSPPEVRVSPLATPVPTPD